MSTKTVGKAGLEVAVQGLTEVLTPGKGVGKIRSGQNDTKNMRKESDPVTTKSPSMADRVRQAREDMVTSGISLSKMVDEAIGVAKDTDNVEFFMDAMAGIDKVATELGLFTSTNGDKWKDLPLARVEAEVRRWAGEGNGLSKKAIELLDTLKDGGILEVLWKTYKRVVRPANQVWSYNQLEGLLEKLVSAHLADAIDTQNLQFIPKRAIVVRIGSDRQVAYLPAQVGHQPIPEAEKGWPWVRKAEARAVEAIFTRMRKSDTGLTAAMAKEGKEGTIFLQAGLKGALIEIRARGPFLIRIVDAFGINVFAPTDWVPGLIHRGKWPDDDLYHAFRAWLKQAE